MKATISPQDTVISFLEYLIDKQAGRPTTLIICHTRAAFLAQILPTLNPPPQTEAAASPSPPPPHPILHPTLSLLSRATHLQLIYTPTLPVLRAYLSTQTHPPSQTSLQTTPLLAILDATLLHHSTSSFSAQGLSLTFSALISAAARSNAADILLAECRDEHDVRNLERGPRLWDARVGLLSGGVRLGGGGGGASVGIGRTVSVRRVVGRWFEFEEKRREGEEMEGDEEEMLV